MKLTASDGSKIPAIIVSFANTAPESAPSTSIGRKIPPGTPEPKQIIVNANFTAKSRSKNGSANSFLINISIFWLAV